MNLLLLIFSILIASPTLAIEQSVSKTDTEYTSIGHSDLENDIKAENEACNNAKRELISYVFGASYQISQNSLRSSGVIEYSQGVSMDTRQVILRGAVVEKSNKSENKDGAKCIIHYPIEEANLEEQRLKSVKNIQISHFTEIGDEGVLRGGVLEIVTIPEDVEVYIDKIRWGTTPIRLNQKLTIGEHTLRLDHPQYKVVEEQFKIGTMKVTRLEKVLKRATGKIKIKTEPSDAEVLIDGESIGKSPTKGIEVLAGKKFVIEAKHPETETISQTLSLGRDEDREMTLNLPSKPAYVSFHVDPSDAEISFSGKLLNSSSSGEESWNQVESGYHSFDVSKEGFETYRDSVTLSGTERKVMAPIRLTITPIATPTPTQYQTKSNEPEKYEPPTDFRSSEFFIGIGWTGSTVPNFKPVNTKECCLFIDLGYRKNITSWLGLKLHYQFAAMISKDSSSYAPDKYNVGETYTKENLRHDLSIELPIFISKALYFSAEIGRSFSKTTKAKWIIPQSGYSGTWGTDMVSNNAQVFHGIEAGIELMPDVGNPTKNAGFYMFINQRYYHGEGGIPPSSIFSGGLGVEIGN